jgi:hypothetical protein
LSAWTFEKASKVWGNFIESMNVVESLKRVGVILENIPQKRAFMQPTID